MPISTNGAPQAYTIYHAPCVSHTNQTPKTSADIQLMVTFDVGIAPAAANRPSRAEVRLHPCMCVSNGKPKKSDSSSESGGSSKPSRLQFPCDMVHFFARSSSHTLPLCLEAKSATSTRQIMENEGKRRTPRRQKPNTEIDEGAAVRVFQLKHVHNLGDHSLRYCLSTLQKRCMDMLQCWPVVRTTCISRADVCAAQKSP